MEKRKYIFLLTSFLLRSGIAIAFFYAALASFLDPLSWISFIPSWVRDIAPAKMLLTIFSIFEIILGIWLLSGKKIYASSIIASITLFGIIILNIANMDIVFRDVPILFASLALAVMYKEPGDS